MTRRFSCTFQTRSNDSNNGHANANHITRVNNMTRKRKRPIPISADIAPCKRHRKGIDEAINACVTHPTLSLYYPQINTLRDHILNKLPTTSKTRRRKIAALGLCDDDRNGCPELDGSYGVDGGLAKLLDRALICKRPDGLSIALEARQQDFLAFSQRNEGVDESSLLEGSTPQSEVSVYVRFEGEYLSSTSIISLDPATTYF